MTEEKSGDGTNMEPAEVEMIPEFATTAASVSVDAAISKGRVPGPMIPDDRFHWQLLSTVVLVNELRFHFFWTWYRREES